MLAVWCGEPERFTGPSASCWPLSCSLLSCAGEVVVWELGSLLMAAVSSAKLHVPALSAVLAFHSMDPFHTMAVGQGIDLF